MTTELTLPERAAVALGAAEHEKQLALLVAEAQTITEIKNADGRTQCHATYMTLKNARVAISKTGKAAREDAKAFCDAVIAEERRLISITEAEENRLQALRDQWDTAIEAERQAKIRAEQQRVAEHRRRISNIQNTPNDAIGRTSLEIKVVIDRLEAAEIGDDFEEFTAEADSARNEAVAKLKAIFGATIAQEAEAARLQAEREELARLRAEAEQRRQEQERIAAEERAKQEAELAAQRAELEQRQADIARQQAVLEAAQRRRDEEEAEKEAERVRLQELADQALADARNPEPVATILDNEPEFAPVSQPVTAPADTGARIRLGEINARIAPLSITAEGLAQLGFPHVATDKSAKLYRLADFPAMCAAINRHVSAAAHEAQQPSKVAA